MGLSYLKVVAGRGILDDLGGDLAYEMEYVPSAKGSSGLDTWEILLHTGDSRPGWPRLPFGNHRVWWEYGFPARKPVVAY